MLDLGREVKRQVWKFGVQLAGDFTRMARAVEEVRVAKRDMRGPGRHLLADVCQHRRGGHDEKASVVDGHDRAVAAGVQAAARRLDIAAGLPAG